MTFHFQKEGKDTSVIYRFAVVGNPIAHSLSPVIHECFARQMNINLFYDKIQSAEHAFEQLVLDFFAQGGLGLNVTLPFKQKAFTMADQVSVRCKQAGSANTLWMKENQLHADNTDGIGLMRDLSRYISVQGTRILVLGAGGAARGIMHPLLEHNPADIVLANRTLANTKAFQLAFPQVNCISLLEIAGQFDIVINATSASLSGGLITLPTECLSAKPLCYDLSYQLGKTTAFVEYSRNYGCEAVDGLGMLVEQAAEAFFIWHRVMPKTEEVLSFLRSQ